MVACLYANHQKKRQPKSYRVKVNGTRRYNKLTQILSLP